MASKLWRWQRIPARGHIPPARQHAALAATDLHVWLYGGHSATGKLLSDVHSYDVDTEKWRRHVLSNSPPGRARHSAVAHGTDIIVYGGQLATADSPENPGFLYVLHTSPTLRWELKHAVGVLPAPRFDHATTLCDGSMYVYGGRRVGKGDGLDADMPVRNLWVLDCTTYQWTRHDANDSWPPARYGATLSTVGNSDKLVLCGGRDTKKIYDDIWIFDSTNITWMKIVAPSVYMPPPRFGHAAACFFSDTDSVLIVTGGETNRGKLKGDVSTLNFDTKEWTKGKLSGTFKPSSRSGAAFVINPYDRKVLLFGGIAGGNWQCDLLVLSEVSTHAPVSTEQMYATGPATADAVVQRELDRIADAAKRQATLRSTVSIGKPRMGFKANFEDARVNAVVAQLSDEIDSLKADLEGRDKEIRSLNSTVKDMRETNLLVKELKRKVVTLEAARAEYEVKAVENRREMLELRAAAHNDRLDAQVERERVKADMSRLKSERKVWHSMENSYGENLHKTQRLQNTLCEAQDSLAQSNEREQELSADLETQRALAQKAQSELKTLRLVKQKLTKELKFERERVAVLQAKVDARDEADRRTADHVSEAGADGDRAHREDDPKGKKPMDKDGKKGKKEDADEERKRLHTRAVLEKKRRQNVEDSLREFESQKITLEANTAQWQQKISDLEVALWEKDATITDLRDQIASFQRANKATETRARKEEQNRKQLEQTLRVHERSRAKAVLESTTEFDPNLSVLSLGSSTGSTRSGQRPATAGPVGRSRPAKELNEHRSIVSRAPRPGTVASKRPQSAHPSSRVRSRPGRPQTAQPRR